MALTWKRAACFFGAATAAAVLLSRARSPRQSRSLSGQVVLITGGSRGLGLAMAREFARRGCRLALCARDPKELEKCDADFSRRGVEIFTAICDVSVQSSVASMIEAVTRHYGVIDILVNNAGEMIVSPLSNLELSDFERSMNVMYWGSVYTSLAVLPSMRARASGRIVTITSIGGKVSVPHLLSYSCAKAALLAFSEGLRSEVQNFGIEVTTIVPGLMRTGSQVNALFKGNCQDESAWFGIAASLPALSLSAPRAARTTVNAICTGRAEKVLGVPAKILMYVHALFPGSTSRILGIVNSLLPAGSAGSSLTPGRYLENDHGFLYRLLTITGRRAGHSLNQPLG